MAKEVSKDLLTELTDLVSKRRELCKLSLAAKLKKIMLPASKKENPKPGNQGPVKMRK
jgi:hypothetical protein